MSQYFECPSLCVSPLSVLDNWSPEKQMDAIQEWKNKVRRRLEESNSTSVLILITGNDVMSKERIMV